MTYTWSNSSARVLFTAVQTRNNERRRSGSLLAMYCRDLLSVASHASRLNDGNQTVSSWTSVSCWDEYTCPVPSRDSASLAWGLKMPALS